ncbi:MAG TPA: dihydropteroate synthase [Gammaproteobacteria bacterium]|nr:dihydropteroate synthase [Gammaproteobacteria bacterium]
MAIYLGLGSNRGDRRENLRLALTRLESESVDVVRVSPVVESPALLPPDAAPDWNSPYLNLVAECRSSLSPDALLDALKQIERSLGRTDVRRWAPRPIDIDILLFDDALIADEKLTIPHAALSRRPFVLTPLSALAPGLTIAGTGRTALELNAELNLRIPLWMGIINLTPDSFSDGGAHQTWPDVEALVDEMTAAGAHILDFGAESTRPGATALTAAEEWSRLEPTLSAVIDKYRGDALGPKISVDTYHAGVAAKAIALGVDIINDVGGLQQPDMIELAAGSEIEIVAMHNLGLPADPDVTLPTDSSAVDQIEDWLDARLDAWRRAGLRTDRIVFDPGIGFGKNPLQSLELLRGIDRLNDRGLRLLVGHSRKSFMKRFAGAANDERDLVTIGASMALIERGVDILRVHDVPGHAAAYRGWAHMRQSKESCRSSGEPDVVSRPR